jgi:hypothetical protein
MAITRTAWTDDDGSGTSGTVINNAVKTELYNQIDAALAAPGAFTGDLTLKDAATYSLIGSGANGVGIAAIHASGGIRFYTGGTTKRWEIDAAGSLLPATSATLNIGSGSLPAAEIYANTYRSSHTIPMASLNPTADTGTTLVVNASGWMQKLTSSARYKEHIDPWTVSPETLQRFVARSPKRWDYTGQPTGAAGFIAEDLHDLAPDADGRSPLLNYDADGRPESNRDFAIIGLQHLVIQDLWRRVAALEGHAHG